MIRKSVRAVFLLMLVPIGLCAQSTTSGSPRAQGPRPYGNGEKHGLSYAGDSFVRNVLIIDLRAESSYDDNVLGRNTQRRGDVTFLFGPGIGFRRQGKQLTLALNYHPGFIVYRKTQGRNSLDHGLQFDANYQLDSRLALRARGSLLRRTGIFQPHPSAQFMPELGSPASLNETVFTPQARQFEHNLRFDAVYQTSRRTSFALFAGFLERDFDRKASGERNLRRTEERNTGLLYHHRLSPTSTLGITYLLQDFRFGPETRVLANSTFFSFARELSPTVTLNVFGGPQYTRLHDRITLSFFPFTFRVPVFRAEWHWALGGDLTKRSEKIVFQITAQRQVTDGGGLLGLASSSFVGVSVRRRFSGRWNAIWSAGYARTSPLQPGLLESNIQSQTAGFGLERSLRENLAARLGYDFTRQRSSAQDLPLANLNRNRVYLGFFYRFGQIALGR